MQVKRPFILRIALSLIWLSFLLFADNPLTSITSAVSQLCGSLTGLLPVVSMLMILVGAVVYAAGQIMGAETRARANVWATAALTGALVGILISSVTPPLLGTIYGKEVTCNGPNCGSQTCSGSEFCCNVGGTCCTADSISCSLNGCGGCSTFGGSCNVASDCCSGNCISLGFGGSICA